MKHFLGGIVLICFFAWDVSASAQTITYYTGQANGSYENNADWSQGSPTATTIGSILTGANFPVGPGETFTGSTVTTYTITLTSPQEEARALFFRAQASAPTGTGAGDGVVNFEISSGSTLTIDGPTDPSLYVSNGATLNLNGGGTIVDNSGVLAVGVSDLGFGITYSGAFAADTGTGNLNLTAGTINFASADGLSIGEGSAAVGVMTQSGASIVVGSALEIGSDSGTGTYNLEEGTLSLSGAIVVGESTGASGTLNQTGGALSADTLFVGTGGTGVYNLSGGTAMFNSNLLIGDGTGSSGTLNQSSGTLFVTNATTIGNVGTGIYSMTGGKATFTGGLIIDSGGTFTQTAGNVVIGSGSALSLTNAGGSYSLNGGTLQIGAAGLTGTAGGGNLNIGGGTLITQGDATDALNGTLTGNSTINATGTLSISGTLTGNGSLTVGSGTVQASTANLPQISGVALQTGSTFDLTTSGNLTDTFTGQLSGKGNLETGMPGVDNAGATITAPAGYTLVLPNTVSLTGGTTTIAAGTGVKAANGTFNTITNTGAGSSFEVGGAGAGSVTVLGTASVSTLTVDSGSTLHIGNGAGVNVIGTLTNNGTLGTLAPESTLTVSGALNQPQQATLAQEGTLVVRTNGVTSDKYAVASATLFGTIRVVGVGSNSYDIVTTAPGQLTAENLNSHLANGLSLSPNSALFTSTLSFAPAPPPGADILVLTTVQNPLSPFATTPNQAAVAQALDRVIQTPPANFVPLLTELNGLSTGSISSALEQLTPESYLYMRDIAFENSTFLGQKVDGFLGNLRAGYTGLDTSGLSILGPAMDSRLGQSLGSLLAYNNEGSAPNGVNYYPDDGESAPPMMSEPPPPSGPATISDSTDARMSPTVAPPPSTSVFDGSGVGFNEFISGDVILADLNQDNSGSSQPKAHYTAGNATAGVSFRVNSNLAAGVLFDYNHTDARTDPQGSHVRVDSYSPGVFATYFERGFYANGLFTFGYNNYSDNRNLAIGGSGASATSNPDGEQYAANFDGGYDFHPDRAKRWTLGPTAGIGYTHLDVDSFRESGAGPADLAVDSQGADSLRARLGGRVVYLVRSGPVSFQPNLTFSYQHEFLDDPYNLTSSFDIPGTPAFATRGSNSGRDTGLIGLGVTATLDNSMSLYLDYLAEIGGDDYFVQSIEAGLKASF